MDNLFCLNFIGYISLNKQMVNKQWIFLGDLVLVLVASDISKLNPACTICLEFWLYQATSKSNKEYNKEESSGRAWIVQNMNILMKSKAFHQNKSKLSAVNIESGCLNLHQLSWLLDHLHHKERRKLLKSLYRFQHILQEAIFFFGVHSFNPPPPAPLQNINTSKSSDFKWKLRLISLNTFN